MKDDRHLTPEEELAFWYFERFVELTHDVQTAQELVMLGYDPRTFEELLGKGCDVEQAKRILAPV